LARPYSECGCEKQDLPATFLRRKPSSARLQGVCFNCIKGEIHPYKLNESDETETHPYSGSSLVVPSADHLTVLAVDLLRKVMMYPEPENFEDPGHYIVIDYLRQEIPLRSEDVIVPFFPEKEDMVLVQGDAGEEPWLGHIQRLQEMFLSAMTVNTCKTVVPIYCKLL